MSKLQSPYSIVQSVIELHFSNFLALKSPGDLIKMQVSCGIQDLEFLLNITSL